MNKNVLKVKKCSQFKSSFPLLPDKKNPETKTSVETDKW